MWGLGGFERFNFLRKELFFSTPRTFFVGFSFFVGIGITVWQYTIKSLPQLIIAPTPQVHQELPCWHNYEEKERGKLGQDEDQGGDFCHSEGRRDRREDQGGKIRRMRKELVGWMKVIMVLLCLTTEVYNNYFATSLKLHFYDAVILSWCNHRLL